MTIRIAPDLVLPTDVVTQAIAILARRGAGKTYTAGVLVEEVISAGLPVVILDPTGAWWGLRSAADGKHPGLPVVILGGQHGDVPLETTAGMEIANVVVEHPGAYVIDLSGFESRRAEQRFAADFLERLYRAKAARREALLVVVDEADLFAPQRPGDEQARTLGALEAIVRRGRIRGLGVLLITQRAAVLNKNVLTQVEVLVAMQTTGPQDRAAIDEWIKGNGTPEERATVLDSLASLERGEAWVWSPSWLRILQRVRIRAKRTFDSGRTPEAGESLTGPTTFAPVDLAALGERILATREKAKADDPATLRREITTLKNVVALYEAQPAPEPITERVEVPVLNGEVERLMAVAVTLGHVGEEIARVGGIIVSKLELVASAPRAAETPRPHGGGGMSRQPGAPTGTSRINPMSSDPLDGSRTGAGVEASSPADGALIGKAERAILGSLTAYPIPLTREQLAFLADYLPRSKGYTNALGTLRSRGLITPGFPAEATPEGRAVAAVSADDVLASGDPTETWLARFGRAERAILEELIRIYPGSAEREELARIAGFEHPRSKGYTNALGRLRGLALVDGFAIHPDFARLLDR